MFVGDAQHQQANSIGNRQPHCFERTGCALLIPFVGHAATLTRTAAFTYDAASGFLTKEIVEPDTSALFLITEYTYDAYGNKTASTTRRRVQVVCFISWAPGWACVLSRDTF